LALEVFRVQLEAIFNLNYYNLGFSKTPLSCNVSTIFSVFSLASFNKLISCGYAIFAGAHVVSKINVPSFLLFLLPASASSLASSLLPFG